MQTRQALVVPAQLVIGQPSLYDHGACNHDSSSQSTVRVSASADSICGVADTAKSLEEQRSKANMAVDSQGNLFVPDIENNRVLEYNRPFATGNDTVADQVWGQSNFSFNTCNAGSGTPSASSLCFNYEFWDLAEKKNMAGSPLILKVICGWLIRPIIAYCDFQNKQTVLQKQQTSSLARTVLRTRAMDPD
jgi:hypothetical protein